MLNPSGKAIIFSAPSGAGKTTIVRAMLESDLPLAFSISATSRDPRPNEKDGTDYHFIGINGFKEAIDHDELLEWEEVYPDQFYGTLKSEIQRIWDSGCAVLFDVDVYGGITLKQQLGANALAIFVQPPSLEELATRLRNRQTETEEKIRIRLDKASEEMAQREHFDHVLVNDRLQDALKEAREKIATFLAT